MVRNILTLSVAALLLPVLTYSAAQDQQQPQRQRQRPGGFGGFGGPVVAPELAEKLGLSADQKDKIAKLQADYDKQTEGARAKLQEAFKNKDREAIRQASEALRTGGGSREELVNKIKGVLSDDQKKQFDEARQRRPGFGGAAGFGGRGGQPGVILSSGLQDRLELTAEQKEKLAQLQKDVDAKLGSILTAEQKKRLDELKQSPFGQRPPRPPQQ